MTKNANYYIERVLAILAAVILFYTLYFKFSGHPSSVALFTELGVEPWGRIGTGVLEFIAGGLLLLRNVSFHGALLGLGIMAGAVLSHLAIIGIEFQGDYQLFVMACIVLACCAGVLVLRKEEIQTFIAEVKNQ